MVVFCKLKDYFYRQLSVAAYSGNVFSIIILFTFIKRITLNIFQIKYHKFLI